MPRKGHVKKRQSLPDIKFGSTAVTKFINSLMRQGKKSVAEKIMYRALDIAGEKLGAEPFEVFTKAMDNVRPLVEVRPRRVGGATYQVPMEVSGERGTTLAIRWLLDAARSRSGKSMGEKLASEIVDASHNQGSAAKKREDTHKMAEANRAFAHFRF